MVRPPRTGTGISLRAAEPAYKSHGQPDGSSRSNSPVRTVSDDDGGPSNGCAVPLAGRTHQHPDVSRRARPESPASPTEPGGSTNQRRAFAPASKPRAAHAP